MTKRFVLGAVVVSMVCVPALYAQSTDDQQIASSVRERVAQHKYLSDVQVAVNNGVVTLSGTAASYANAMEAEKDARHVKDVQGVVDHIQVNAGNVSDEALKKDIQDRLTYDRIGMGQTFNAMTVEVRDGVVTLGGSVRDYPDRDSAMDVVQDAKGVRGVIDHIEVAPLSPMDDELRLEAARRIYSKPTLERYAIDPAHPIRIIVENGHITLAGVVQSQVDKSEAQAALIGMTGVFGVTNDLVVAGGH